MALDGRWLDAASNVVENATVPATMKVYTNDAANAVAVASAPVTLATDADGFFRTVATNLTLPSGCRTYWLGVTPQGGTEIAPRMKVSPAPFAIHAAEARAVEVETLTVDGTVTIGRLTNSTATVGTVAVTNDLSIHGIDGVGNLYLDGIDLTGGGLALFRLAQSGRLTLSLDGQTSVEETVQNLDFSEDGILCIRVTFSGKNVTSCKPWLRVGFRRPGVGWDYSVNAQSSFTQIPIPETGRSYFLTQPVQGGTEIHIVASMTGTSEATMTINYTFYAAGIE